MIRDSGKEFSFGDAHRAILRTDEDIEHLKREINIKSAGKALIELAMKEAGGITESEELLAILNNATLPDEQRQVVNFAIERGLNSEFTAAEIEEYLGKKGARFFGRMRILNGKLANQGVPYRLSPRPGEGVAGKSTYEKHYKFYHRDILPKDDPNA